jgi:sirohydrochlorin ferrochelatase
MSAAMETRATSGRRTALVLVDHGSRSAASNASLEEVTRQIEAMAGDRFVAVLPSHMEIAAPSIADAFASAVAAGAELVVVALYFLAPGRHSEQDVPRLAAEAAAGHPGIEFAVTTSLGPDEMLSALVLARVAETLEAQGS